MFRLLMTKDQQKMNLDKFSIYRERMERHKKNTINARIRSKVWILGTGTFPEEQLTLVHIVYEMGN